MSSPIKVSKTYNKRITAARLRAWATALEAVLEDIESADAHAERKAHAERYGRGRKVLAEMRKMAAKLAREG